MSSVAGNVVDMKPAIPILLMTATLAAAASTPALAAGKRIVIGDNYFVRPTGVPTVTVARGERVTWSWRGRGMHNVTVARGPVRFASSTRSTGTFSRRLARRGIYSIFCTIHGPRDQSLRLVVR